MPDYALRKDVYHSHFDETARGHGRRKERNQFYYRAIKSFILENIYPKASILEVGCGTGEILAAMQPSRGVGIDLNPESIRLAQKKYPQYAFTAGLIKDLQSTEKFDYIILVDIIDHVYDIVDIFQSLRRFSHPATKIILTTINPWWDPILMFAQRLGAKRPEGLHNFVEKRNLLKILELCDFSAAYSGYLLFFPIYVPGLSYLLNTLGTRIWGLNKFSFVQYMIIQPLPENTTDLSLGCSVIIPCYNEEKDIEAAVRRVPRMGIRTEIIVVNDGSTDKSVERVRALQKEFSDLKLVDYSPNKGKGHAVHQGFEAATQDVFMIFDADMSVEPEELPRFFEPLNRGRCQFVNGTRMVYPMEKNAMKILNRFGNKIFGLMMTLLTCQNLTDTLCGTKAFYRKDYPYFYKDMDRWGDFDLLLSAARMRLKIMEIPVHYKERRAGMSKMRALCHGMHLLRVVMRGFYRLAFKKRQG